MSFFFLSIFFLAQVSPCVFRSPPPPPATATPVLDPAICVRSPHSFYWRMVLGPKICVLYICFLLLGCNICVYTYQCIGTSVNVSTGNHLYLCYTQHEFVLTLLTLIHYQVDHSSLLPLLFCELSNSEKSDNHHPPSIHLMVEFENTCRAASGWLTQTPVENNFIT